MFEARTAFIRWRIRSVRFPEWGFGGVAFYRFLQVTHRVLLPCFDLSLSKNLHEYNGISSFLSFPFPFRCCVDVWTLRRQDSASSGRFRRDQLRGQSTADRIRRYSRTGLLLDQRV